jgi:hypothetical protein
MDASAASRIKRKRRRGDTGLIKFLNGKVIGFVVLIFYGGSVDCISPVPRGTWNSLCEAWRPHFGSRGSNLDLEIA